MGSAASSESPEQRKQQNQREQLDKALDKPARSMAIPASTSRAATSVPQPVTALPSMAPIVSSSAPLKSSLPPNAEHSNRVSSGSAQSPSDAPSPRGRRSSFSFLRRSKSKKSLKGDSQPLVAPTAPQIPVPTVLPPSSYGERDFPSATGRDSATAAARVNSSNGVPFPPSSYSTRYDPNAFYNNRHKMGDNQSISTQSQAPVSPTAAVDPYARTESMTNRGRYSYASSVTSNVNSPRRVRRRKDPTPFNVLVVGSKNSGKTSFIEFLTSALTRPKHLNVTSARPKPVINRDDTNPAFTSQYFETDLEGERIGLTLYDSKGLERHVVDLQLREISNFIESKFQETFSEEQKVLRATGTKDTHIHCVLLILDPARIATNIAVSKQAPNPRFVAKQRIIGGLDEQLDIELLRKLQGKTTVIPVISKADTITTAHMTFLKRTIWDTFKKLKFDPLEALDLDSDPDTDEDDNENASEYGSASSAILESDVPDADGDRTPTEAKNVGLPADISKAPQLDSVRASAMSVNVELPYLPMSVISPDIYDPGTVGRRFPWGFADPYDAEHCDFVKLKDSVFSEWRTELRSAARERWYENWRTTRLRKRSVGGAGYQAVSPSTAYGTPTRATSSHGAPTTPDVMPPMPNHNRQRTLSASQIGVAVTNGEAIVPGRSQVA